jgi:hypothetical protein
MKRKIHEEEGELRRKKRKKTNDIEMRFFITFIFYHRAVVKQDHYI